MGTLWEVLQVGYGHTSVIAPSNRLLCGIDCDIARGVQEMWQFLAQMFKIARILRYL